MRGTPEESDDDTDRARRKRRFFLIRVSVLLVVLFVVVLYAVRDYRSRSARNDWSHTVDVAVVLVHVDGTATVDASLIAALQARAAVLEDRLQAEARRHRRDSLRPFKIRVLGPVDVRDRAPSAASSGPVDLAKQAVNLERWLADVDPRASIEPDLWDTRIYVSVRPPASDTRSFVEGQSQEGGRIGVVDVELDASMVDLTLFVVAHELMHTLGASDRYDAAGRTLVPDGLAEPDRVPLYPQRFAEVMGRNRPVSPSSEVVPDSLDELAVGERTAKEIGWRR
jgi:hypothetical protein